MNRLHIEGEVFIQRNHQIKSFMKTGNGIKQDLTIPSTPAQTRMITSRIELKS